MRIDSVTALVSHHQIEVSGQKQQDRTAAQNPTAQLNVGRADNEGASN